MDKKLKELLEAQNKKVRRLSEELLDGMDNPTFYSGKDMNPGDKPLFLLEKTKSRLNETESSLRMILLDETEIDFYAKNYKYSSGNENSIKVIKKK